MVTRVAIVAGELSGDRLAAGLIRALSAKHPNIEFEGVTGPGMRAAGCRSLLDCEALAVMGIFEVLRHLPRLLGIRRRLRARWQDNPPDLFIGVDAPDFNLGLARVLRASGVPTVQYVCPSVWAWREGRVKNLRRSVDLILCLLPFEPDFLASHSLVGEFVGHPLAQTIEPEPKPGRARTTLGLPDTLTVALLPGSRRGEVGRLAETFLDTAEWLTKRRPDINFVAGMANPETAQIFSEAAKGRPIDIAIRVGQTEDVLAAADAVLVASGTATLETALNLRPMVVAYRLSALTYGLIRLLRLMNVERYALPNLLAGREVVPEYVQKDAHAEALGAALVPLLDDSEARAGQLDAFAKIAATLEKDADTAAAAAVSALLERTSSSQVNHD